MQSVATCKPIQKNIASYLIEGDAKNALSINTCSKDMMGLAWIFMDDKLQELS